MNSKQKGKAIEGKVANFVQQKVEVKGFALELFDEFNKRAGDIDILTEKQIIEVKKSWSAVDLRQIDKYVNSSNPYFFNFERREVVLYIDESIDLLNPKIVKDIDELENMRVKVVNSLEELEGVLK